MIKVLVVDDYAPVREGVRAFLEQVQDITVVGECSGGDCNGDQIVEVAAGTDPDVVLMGLNVPGTGHALDGLQTTRALLAAQPHRRVIIHASAYRPDLAEEARDVGAVGYVVKVDHTNDLVAHIRAVAQLSTAWSRPPSP